MINEEVLKIFRHPLMGILIVWFCVSWVLFLHMLIRPMFRTLVFSNTILSESVVAKVKEANLISHWVGTTGANDGDIDDYFIDVQFIVEYDYRGKTFRSELGNIYSGSQPLPSVCESNNWQSYIECRIKQARAFAPDTRFSFIQHSDSKIPLDTIKIVMATIPPGMRDVPITIPVFKFYPQFNFYSMSQPFLSWVRVAHLLVVFACFGFIPLLLVFTSAYTQKLSVFTMMGMWAKWCLLLSLLTFSIIEMYYRSTGKPPKWNDRTIFMPSDERG